MIELKSVSIAIQNHIVLEDISFSVPKDSIACLVGKSGCGKTTMLRAIAGFTPILNGEIWIKGVCVNRNQYQLPAIQRHVGMVFQDIALFPHLNAMENISFGIRQQSAKQISQQIDELTALLSLEDTLHKYPHNLSGGQQQRVALARAIAPKPNVLLMDEPFSSLDVDLREDLAVEIRKVLKQDNMTTIMVSHQQLEAYAMSDFIGVMQQGRLLQWAKPFDIYHQPNSESVANFVGEGLFINATVINDYTVNTQLGYVKSDKPHGCQNDEKVKLLLRPDDIIHDDDSPKTALVKHKTFRGSHFLYTLELSNGEQVLSLVPSHHDHKLGEPIGIRLEIDHLVAFPVS